MTIMTHVLVGYALSAYVGSPAVVVVAAAVPDIDHLLALRSGAYSNTSSFITSLFQREDVSHSQRNILHNIVVTGIVSLAAWIVSGSAAFSAGYISHILLDMIDGSFYYPLYPSKRFAFRGIIPYMSLQETLFACLVGLMIVWRLWI